MDFCKVVALTLLSTLIQPSVAGEIKNPWDRAMFWTTTGPTVFTSLAADFTTNPGSYFAPAKGDALAFIGSGGEIRGAQFEQAVRFYRATYSPPHMPDDQLAGAIAASF
ncbi:DUF2388 domain-containing protein [Pseudomonas fluorescens]|uniref:DUF2388 domain-containing protein n=1 Tax=Pseudomonas fluorescens TaxID=294 RepID=UPI001241350B|nr:DUF2388 domain-containing protein [Pseudomonas fluorescens]